MNGFSTSAENCWLNCCLECTLSTCRFNLSLRPKLKQIADNFFQHLFALLSLLRFDIILNAKHLCFKIRLSFIFRGTFSKLIHVILPGVALCADERFFFEVDIFIVTDHAIPLSGGVITGLARVAPCFLPGVATDANFFPWEGGGHSPLLANVYYFIFVPLTECTATLWKSGCTEFSRWREKIQSCHCKVV